MAISQGKQGRGTLFTEINITPLTDIFLVLLIMMMVIAPMFQNTNKSIQVPTIQSGQSMQENQVTVEVTKQGQMFVNGTATPTESLESTLKQIQAKENKKLLLVRADKATHSSEVLKVFEAAGQAGYEKLTIAGEPLSGAREKTLNDSTPATPSAPAVKSTPNSPVEAPQ